MSEILTLCKCPENQTECERDYKPRSETDPTCWRFREDTGHCNFIKKPEKKTSTYQFVGYEI